jgi:PAS domain S-box-containing protein
MAHPPNETPTQVILDSIADGVFTVDSQWRITSFNRAAEKITGIKKEETLKRHCWEVFKASICERQCALRYTMESGKPVVNQSIFILNAQGDRMPVSISTAALKDQKGKIVGGVETFRDLSVVEALRKELAARHSFQDIISKNKEMLRLFHMVELISESDTTVLIEGESGTGKELFAKAIHSLSNRKAGPMVTLNCGSLPDTLLESELFGYKAGAFTDAKKDKPGRLAQAEGGTIFLDEIGDVSPLLQVRLLRILQDRIYEPLGSTRSEKADVRIVAASNKNIRKLVKKGLFREDLYYRINVVRLYLPPLRQRKEDIPLLTDHFIHKFNRLNNRDLQGLSPEGLAALMAYDYPGNIRELENIIEYATVVCKNGLIGMEHLPDHIRKHASRRIPEAQLNANVLTPSDKKHSFNEIEKGYILSLLSQNNWSRRATADQMGIHPTTLWRKMKRLNILAPAISFPKKSD